MSMSPLLGAPALIVIGGALPLLAPDPDPCALLTSEEIQAAAGWVPASAKPETHGTTLTCTYNGAKPGPQTIVVVVARPAPKVTTSAALAERRSKAVSELGIKVTALEGLGVPAIRSDEGSGPITVEAVVGARLLGLTAASFDAAKGLAEKAIPRLKAAG